MAEKYTLTDTSAEEMALFYSSREPGRDQELGCIGHMRQDFGRNGVGFWTSWEDHCQQFKTQAFKNEFDDIVNTFREGFLKDRASLSAFCHAHPSAKLNNGRSENYGLKLKTDSHVFYLRLCPLQHDYNLFCYAYNREALERQFPSLADTQRKPSLTDKIAKNKEKAAEQVKSTLNKSKEQENSL